MASPREDPPLLRATGIVKRFGAFTAVDGASLQVGRGEIHGLLGENGAGKSTLTACISGFHRPEGGRFEFDGQAVQVGSPAAATRLGIGMVHQHVVLVPVLTVLENILAATRQRGWLLQPARMRERLRTVCADLALDIDLDAPVGSLSVGQQQWVEILQRVVERVRLLILDEPTAVLGPLEAGRLFALLRTLAGQGTAVIVITHKLDEALRCDRVTVMRKGRVVSTLGTQGLGKGDLSRLMVGRETRSPRRRGDCGVQERLAVRGLCTTGSGRTLHDIDLSVRRGEILGIAGVSGNGQRELFEVLAGVRPAARGEIRCDGVLMAHQGPAAVMRAGIGHIPQDRFAEGLVGEFGIAQNLLLGAQRSVAMSRLGLLRPAAIEAAARVAIQRFAIAARATDTPVRTLSGGNAQKVVIARELRHARSVLLANQPTRGLDIGVIEDVHALLLEKRQEGLAILLASDELDDLFALCDRIAVMASGRLIHLGSAADCTMEQVGRVMAGGEAVGQASEVTA